MREICTSGLTSGDWKRVAMVDLRRPSDSAATAPVANSTAGARRQVTDGDGHAEFVGQSLQFAFPQPHASAVAAAAIGGDYQARARGTRPVPCLPPAPDAWTAKLAVSWSMPTLTQPVLPAMS